MERATTALMKEVCMRHAQPPGLKGKRKRDSVADDALKAAKRRISINLLGKCSSSSKPCRQPVRQIPINKHSTSKLRTVRLIKECEAMIEFNVRKNVDAEFGKPNISGTYCRTELKTNNSYN